MLLLTQSTSGQAPIDRETDLTVRSHAFALHPTNQQGRFSCICSYHLAKLHHRICCGLQETPYGRASYHQH